MSTHQSKSVITVRVDDQSVAVCHHVGDDVKNAIAMRHAMQRRAHFSGNTIDPTHCPFCGSGAIFGRSDGTIECDFCFSGETEFLTYEGVKTLKETVGTVQRVLVSERTSVQVTKGASRRGQPKLDEATVVAIRDTYAQGDITQAALARQHGLVQGTVKQIVERRSWQHVGGGGHLPGARATRAAKYGDGHSAYGGRWVDAEIRAFGVQPLLKVTLSRQDQQKVVHATGSHRWFVHPPFGSSFRYDHKVVRDTVELRAGDRLAALYPRDRLRQNRDTTPSPFGIAHGFTFGDGSLCTHGGAKVVLWGDKDRALLPYFAASRQRALTNANGTAGIEIKDLPEFFKSMPSRAESLSYLYGWLAGYFAADGSVSKTGSASLDCVDRGVLERVQDLCTQLAIGTYSIRETQRVGLGQTEPSSMWRLTFVAHTLTADFFVIPEHRARFEARMGVKDQVEWTVVSVEETDRVEEVYCAVVPGHENFTLADNVNVMNCSAAFTIQIQPLYPAYPMTDPTTGEAIPYPGQPDPGAPGQVDAPDAAVSPTTEPEDDEPSAAIGGATAPPFGKTSSFRAPDGRTTDWDGLVASLAGAR